MSQQELNAEFGDRDAFFSGCLDVLYVMLFKRSYSGLDLVASLP